MTQNDDKELSRRKFLRLAATVVGAGVLTGGGTVVYRMADLAQTVWHFNPAFRIREISATEIELFTHLANGEVIMHRFSGLEADLLRQLANERKVEEIILPLAQKHNLTEADCRKQVDGFLQDFSQAGLVYAGEKILVKIQEAQNG